MLVNLSIIREAIINETVACSSTRTILIYVFYNWFDGIICFNYDLVISLLMSTFLIRVATYPMKYLPSCLPGSRKDTVWFNQIIFLICNSTVRARACQLTTGLPPNCPQTEVKEWNILQLI